MSRAAPAAAANVAAATPVEPPEQHAERFILAIEVSTELRPKLIATREETRRLIEEKEQLNSAWATVTQLIADKKHECQGSDDVLGEKATVNAAQLKILKQQVRELLTLNASKQVEARGQGLKAGRAAMVGYGDSERELKADRRDLSVVLKELETGHEELVRVMKAENDKASATLRFQFESQAKELAALYEDKLSRCREEMNGEREKDLATIEKRKTTQISTMLAAHEQAFTDIKAYFNEITHSNLDLIKSLKEEVDDLRKKESADEKVLQATAEANKRMSDPMRKAIADVKRLREEREAYRLDLAASLECKAATMVVSDRLDALRWEHEILGQRYERLVGERDALARKFREAVHEVQQKAGFKALLLEQKLAVVAEEKERAQLVLGEVLSQANIDVPGKAETLRKGAEGLLQRDGQLQDLQDELERLTVAYDGVVDNFRGKMARNNIPESEIGFKLASARDILLGGGK